MAAYPLKVVVEAVDRATGPLGRISASIRKTTAPIGRLAAGAARVATRVGLIAGAVGGAFAVAVGKTAACGDMIDELSQKAGVSARSFQKMAYATSFSSIGAEDLASSLVKLNKNTIAARLGNKGMQEWFQRAGLSMQNLAKLKPDEVLERVLAAANKLEGAKKTALLEAILGKGGSKFADTTSAFKELTAEAEKYGLILDEKAIAQSAEFENALGKTKLAVTGLWRQISSLFLPSLTRALTATTKWIVANRGLIKVKVVEWMGRLADGWRWTVRATKSAIVWVEKITGKIADFFGRIGGWRDAIKQFALDFVGTWRDAFAGVKRFFDDSFLGRALGSLNGVSSRLAVAGGIPAGMSPSQAIPASRAAAAPRSAPLRIEGAPGESGRVDVHVTIDNQGRTQTSAQRTGPGKLSVDHSRRGWMMPDVGAAR